MLSFCSASRRCANNSAFSLSTSWRPCTRLSAVALRSAANSIVSSSIRIAPRPISWREVQLFPARALASSTMRCLSFSLSAAALFLSADSSLLSSSFRSCSRSHSRCASRVLSFCFSISAMYASICRLSSSLVVVTASLVSEISINISFLDVRKRAGWCASSSRSTATASSEFPRLSKSLLSVQRPLTFLLFSCESLSSSGSGHQISCPFSSIKTGKPLTLSCLNFLSLASLCSVPATSIALAGLIILISDTIEASICLTQPSISFKWQRSHSDDLTLGWICRQTLSFAWHARSVSSRAMSSIIILSISSIKCSICFRIFRRSCSISPRSVSSKSTNSSMHSLALALSFADLSRSAIKLLLSSSNWPLWFSHSRNAVRLFSFCAAKPSLQIKSSFSKLFLSHTSLLRSTFIESLNPLRRALISSKATIALSNSTESFSSPWRQWSIFTLLSAISSESCTMTVLQSEKFSSCLSTLWSSQISWFDLIFSAAGDGNSVCTRPLLPNLLAACATFSSCMAAPGSFFSIICRCSPQHIRPRNCHLGSTIVSCRAMHSSRSRIVIFCRSAENSSLIAASSLIISLIQPRSRCSIAEYVFLTVTNSIFMVFTRCCSNIKRSSVDISSSESSLNWRCSCANSITALIRNSSSCAAHSDFSSRYRTPAACSIVRAFSSVWARWSCVARSCSARLRSAARSAASCVAFWRKRACTCSAWSRTARSVLRAWAIRARVSSSVCGRLATSSSSALSCLPLSLQS